MRVDIKKTIKWLKIALILLMACTVAFIFVNSALPPEQSSEQSDAVGNFIGQIIPPDTDLGAFVQQYLRKIAHFTEYGLLGIEIALYILAFERKRAVVLHSIAVPFAVGLIDESIQMASGRGPSIGDVWIDVGGFFTFSLLCYGIAGVAVAIIKFVRNHRDSTPNG